MDVNEFDFELPEQLIAQTPLLDRSASRLLCLDKKTGAVKHRQFTDLIDYLQPDDVLVMNDTKVLPARLYGIKQGSGAKAEVLLLKQQDGNLWEALVKPGKRLKLGSIILFGTEDPNDPKPPLQAEIISETEMGGRTLIFTYEGIFHQILDRLGTMPLPPYIKEQLPDKERYQTVYAKHQGSAAAPTAGLHFTPAIIQSLIDKGVQIVYITLHVGLGTFRPVSTDIVEEHTMHEEYYEISQQAAELLNAAAERKAQIVAVGTTSARTLESAARRFDGQRIEACSGWTGIYIYPGYQFRLVSSLLTNFHLPKSTLVMLVSALAGREAVMHAYAEAIEQQYRFFSFGDAMLIYEEDEIS